jgi:hypothetical protein
MNHRININDQFAVRLTTSGLAHLERVTTVRRSDESILMGGGDYVRTCHPVRDDGTRRFHLHELMRYFGPLMFAGNTELPFETDIEWLNPSE